MVSPSELQSTLTVIQARIDSAVDSQDYQVIVTQLRAALRLAEKLVRQTAK